MQAILGWFAGEEEAPEDLPARVRDFPSAVGGELLVREATLAVVNTLAPLRRGTRPAPCSSASTRLARARRAEDARALWGLGWVEFWAGRWDVAADYAARARDISSSTGSRCRRTICRVRSSPSTEDNSTWPGSTRNEVSTSLTSSSPVAPYSSWRSLDSSLGGGEIPSWPRNGSRRPTGGPRSSGGGSPASAGGAATRSSFCSSSAGSRTRSESSTSGRPTPFASLASGCSPTSPDAVGLSPPLKGRSIAPVRCSTEAVTQHNEVGDPFGAARALLALGIVRRRERKKRGAREAIEAALDGFEQLGAANWAAKARSELGRIGGRTREEGLTPAELRVAALVAEGRTNREVAAALFSPSGRSRVTYPMFTPSSACARERSSPVGCREQLSARESSDVLTFPMWGPPRSFGVHAGRPCETRRALTRPRPSGLSLPLLAPSTQSRPKRRRNEIKVDPGSPCRRPERRRRPRRRRVRRNCPGDATSRVTPTEFGVGSFGRSIRRARSVRGARR